MAHLRRILSLALIFSAVYCASAGELFEPGRVVARYYRSDIDDTDQPYSVWLPRDYAQNRAWPLVVSLHGLGGNFRVGGLPREIEDCVVVAPDGRGDTDYKLWGETDVVRVVEEACRRYTIDRDRIYLYGISMGGSGSWQVGVHYPDLFAALGPVCGNADHRVWEKLWNWGERVTTFLTAKKAMIEGTESPAFFAENLINLPSWPIHGDKDNVVPCEHSRSMAAELKKVGAECHYVEVPGAGHGVPGDKVAQMLLWMKQQRRNPWPKHVIFKTAWRRHPGAYWVRLHRFELPFAFARIEAEVAGPNEIRIKTENVEEFSLHLVPPLIDAGKPIRVALNDQPAREEAVPSDGWLRFRKQPQGWQPSKEPAGLHKTPEMEGPISHAFMSSFLIVYGTQGKDEQAKRVAREEAQIAADRWNRWARGRCRFKADTEVKDEDIRNCNLILFGDPATNSLVARFGAKLPIRVEGNAIVFGQKRFQGDDLGLEVVYPNPENPQRYVVLFTGTTWRGVYQISGRFNNWFDWGILDGWNWQDFAVFDDRTYSPETMLAIGFFDNDWQLNPAWTIAGDEPLRVARPPRRTPAIERPTEGVGELYLSDLQPAASRIEKGAVGRDRSFNAFPLTLGGKTYERGLGVHPDCELGFDLGGQFTTFEAVVGTDLEDERSVSEARDKAETIEYTVAGDGQTLYATGRMRWDSEPRHIFIPIQGVRRLDLRAQRRSGPRWLSGPCDWAIARVGEPLLNRVAVRAKFDQPDRLADLRSLDGAWKLAGFAVGEGVALDAHRFGAEAQRSLIDAVVPGSVFAALSAHARPHAPAWGRDVLDAPASVPAGETGKPRTDAGASKTGHPDGGPSGREEVASREWWYWRAFNAPKDWEGRSIWLELDGAAYQADAWLNGRWVGRSTGPFAIGRFDATKGARLGGRNELAIRVVSSPATWAKEPKPFQPAPASQLVTSQELSNAGYPPLGLWRPVRVRAAGPCLLRNLTVETVEIGGDFARLRVRAEAANVVKDKLTVTVAGAIAGDGFETASVPLEQKLEIEGERTAPVEIEVRLPSPMLWWPSGLGGQSLYRLAASLKLDGGAISDEATARFGIRTIELAVGGTGEDRLKAGLQTPPEGGTTYARLRVNGQKSLVLRGAVWMPADAELRLDAPRYERLLRRARECRFNALRVAGGGLAETDLFYDLCDRQGLLVLQELPLTSDGQNAIAGEFLRNCSDAIGRLRTHPSLAVWCVGGSAAPGEPPSALLTARAAALVERLDPARRILGDSPIAGIAQLWTTRSDPATRRVHWQGASVLCAPGIPSPPMPRTVEAGEDRLKAGLRTPPEGGTTYDRMKARTAAEAYGPARTERELLLRAHAAQAAAVQRLVEHLRSEPASAVLGQLNEPLPSCSPALFDGAGAPKPAYYFLQRALAPVAIFADFGGEDRLKAGPRTEDPLKGGLQTLTTLGVGEPLRAEVCVASTPQPLKNVTARAAILDRSLRRLASWESRLDVPADAQARPFLIQWTPDASLVGDVFFVHLRLDSEAGHGLASNLYWFGVVPPRTGQPRLRVAWLTSKPQGSLADPAFLSSTGIEVKRPKPPLTSRGIETRGRLEVDGCDVVVVDAASVFTDYRDDDLRAVADAVARGRGLLVEGVEQPLLDSSLGPLLPVGLPNATPSGMSGRPSPTDLSHPVLEGISFEACPVLARRGASEVKANATVLAQVDETHPLLVESRHGQGRVLALTARAGGELAGWDGLRRFTAAALGYLAGLPHADQRSLVESAVPAPLQALRSLAPARVTAKLRQEGETLLLDLANPSMSLAFLVHVEAEPTQGDGLAPLAFSDNYLCLMPGEKWTIRVDLEPGLDRPDPKPPAAELTVRGWNVAPQRVEGRIEIDGARLRLRRR